MSGRKLTDLTGQHFGELEVVRILPRELWFYTPPRVTYFCRCSCGWTLNVAGFNLTNGMYTSCGCRRRQKSRERSAAKRAQMALQLHDLSGP